MSAEEGATPGSSGIRAWLELDMDSEPIRGALRPAGGQPRRFTGWLGLSAAIEALRPDRPLDLQEQPATE
jgi:hypothetical protein